MGENMACAHLLLLDLEIAGRELLHDHQPQQLPSSTGEECQANIRRSVIYAVIKLQNRLVVSLLKRKAETNSSYEATVRTTNMRQHLSLLSKNNLN